VLAGTATPSRLVPRLLGGENGGMRARFERVGTTDASWKLYIGGGERFDVQWHFHPELELTLIDRGRGRRLVGESNETFTDDDLVLIGANLPHAYVSASDSTDNRAVVAQFRSGFAGDALHRCREWWPVEQLLERASHGLAFGRVDARLRPDVRRLDGLPPGRRTAQLLDVLARLADTDDAHPLAGTDPRPGHGDAVSGRMDAVCRFVQQRHGERFGLADVAAAAHMSPSALSRFFRRVTGRTLTDYVNSVRIETACQLLVDTDDTVATVAARAGFANLSYFNRRFLADQRMRPSQYRQHYRSVRPT
jgi:AraC-like DNA-binding protein